jgi:uncharacterized membrane protein SpoIIM required for sporulation
MNQETTGTNHASQGGRKRAWVYLAATAVVLSGFATSIVLGNLAAGVPPQADENASAHLFQLAMAAQPLLLLLFLAFADWTQKKRIALLVGAQIIAAAVAFGALAWSGY